MALDFSTARYLGPLSGDDEAPPLTPRPPLDFSRAKRIGDAPEPSSFLRRAVADPLVSAAKSVVGFGEGAVGLADIATLGRAGKALEDYAGYRPGETQQALEELYSPEQQAANRAVGEAKGFGGTLAALATHPSVILHKGIETIPMIAGGGAVARALPAGMSRLARGAIGEGALGAGSSAEQTRQASSTGVITPSQAALNLTSGAVTGAITRASGGLANRLGIGDIEQLVAGGKLTAEQAAKIGKKGLARRTAEGALTEGLLEEAPQSAQETALQNIALGRPVGEGVPEATAIGGTLGSVIGAGAGALPQGALPPAVVPPGVVPPPVTPPPGPVAPEWGTTTGVFPQGQPVEPGAPSPLTPDYQTALGAAGGPADVGPSMPAPGAPSWDTALGAGVTTTPREDISGAFRDREIAALLQKTEEERAARGQQREQQGEVAMARGRAEGVGEPQPKTAMQLAFEKAQEVPDERQAKTQGQAARPTADVAAATLQARAAEGQAPTDADVAGAIRAEQARADVAAGRGVLGRAAQEGAQPKGGEPERERVGALGEETVPSRGDSAQQGGEVARETQAQVAAIDAAAHEAATSPRNDLPEPTEAQQKAGNWKHGHVRLHGLDLSIEHPQGSVRRGVDKGGKPWAVTMTASYGYIKGTAGRDKDHIDTYIGEHPESDRVFVVDQYDPKTGRFDEHKVVMGTRSLEEANALYDAHFSDGSGPSRRKAVTEVSVEGFKAWLASGNTKAEFAKHGKTAIQVSEPSAEKPTGTPETLPATSIAEGEIPPPAASLEAKLPRKERRTQVTRRMRISEMSPEDMRRELLVDAVTGLGNKRAYTEAKKLPVQVSLDLDSLKWVNDNLGHDSGDVMLRAFGEALAAETPYGYHLSGDEFVMQGASEAVARAVIERVGARMAGARVEVTLPDGTVISKTGIGFSFGLGGSYEDADVALREHKDERERSGQRPSRGQEPAGVERRRPGEVAKEPAEGEPREPGGVAAEESRGAGVAPQKKIKEEGGITQAEEYKAKPPVKHFDERLDDAGTQAALTQMAENAGWQQRGGELLRDAENKVTGRTQWIPREPWFAELPGRLNESATVEAVKKAIAGEKLGAKERRVVGFMLDAMARGREQGTIVADEEGEREAREERAAIADTALDALSDDDISTLLSYDTLSEADLDRYFASEPPPGDLGAEEAPTEGATGGRGAPSEEARPAESILEETDLKQREEARVATARREADETAARLTEVEKPKATAYGAANKIFTADAATAARERLRSKLGTVRSGLDPEMFQDGLTLAGYHIEAGSRKFGDFAKAMIADLGEKVRPYLRAWYNAVKDNQGFDFGAPATIPAKLDKPTIERAQDLTDEERAIETRFADKILADVDGAVAWYRKEWGNVINTDNARDYSEDYNKDKDSRSLYSAAVHEPASWLVKEVYRRMLVEPKPDDKLNRVLFSGGGTGAGKTTAIEKLPLIKKVSDDAHIVYDSNMDSFEKYKQRIDEVLALGKGVDIFYVWREPVDAMEEGVIPRAIRQGRTAPLHAHVETHLGARDAAPQLKEHYKDDPRVTFTVIDNSHGKGNAVESEFAEIPENQYTEDELKEKLYGIVKEARDTGRIRPAVYTGTVGRYAGRREGEVPRIPPPRGIPQAAVGVAGQGPQRWGDARQPRLEPEPGAPPKGAKEINDVQGDSRAGPEGQEPPRLPADEEGRGVAPVPGEPGQGVRPGGAEPDGGRDRERAEGVVHEEGAGDRDGEAPDTGDIDKPARRAAKRAGRSLKGTNYRITPADSIGTGGWKARARQNIEAIRIVKALAREPRLATHEEQQKLVKYVGWGASELANGIFDNYGRFKEGWEELGQELKNLLDQDEYQAARASTLNAHYTSPGVIGGIYRALEKFGFKGGRILEPGAGVGHFIGLRPEGLAENTRYTAVELDPISAAIAKALYPHEDVRAQDFAKFVIPHGFYDVVIGNPPFAPIKITSDKEYARLSLPLHDYMIVKSLDRLRAGGVMALVTSRYSMDKSGAAARLAIQKQADLIGAIRLPQTAFKENAGTEVVTDVLFFRKRMPDIDAGGEAWSKIVEVPTQDGPTHINEYYAAHPEMVLGEHRLLGSMYSDKEYTVLPPEGDLNEALARAVGRLPAGIYTETTQEKTPERARDADINPTVAKENAYYLKDGIIHQRVEGVGVPQTKSAKHAAIVTRFVPLRDAGLKVLAVQMDKASREADLKAAQKDLAMTYAAFVKEFGPINKESVRKFTDSKGIERESVRYPNIEPFKADPDAMRVASYEIYDRKTGKATKMDIFTERVINPEVIPKIESPVDALHVVMAESGRVDIGQVAKLAGQSVENVIGRLGDAIFKNPESATWEGADSYLSGQVRKKLKYAEASVLSDPGFERNVEALRAALPEDLPPSRIDLQFGMPIVRAEDIKDFAAEVMGLNITVNHLPEFSAWKADGAYNVTNSIAATSEWGTPRYNAVEILDAALNKYSIKVMDYVDKKPVLNSEATAAANEKLGQMKERFERWIWEDGGRADHYVRSYNDTYNDSVKRDFAGPHIDYMRFPGLTTTITPDPHQKRVAYRIIQRGNTYMAHETGLGKTIGSILAGMEMKRLGIKKKPTWVVPNHMLKQFATEFLQLYPAAKILVADEENFSKTSRNRFMGRIASENWDGIIITHSAFNKIPLSAKYQENFINGFLDELRAMLAEAGGDRLKTKQIERAIKRLEQRLSKILSGATQDAGVGFEETGIDQLFIDEAHEYRKIDFVTNMSDIKGVDPNGSAMAFDLYNKQRYLESLYPGRSLVLLSGTPITNTLGEAYSIQRLLQSEALKERGIDNFDAWAATFGNILTELEPDPAGRYRVVSRFAEFRNVGQLSSLFGEVCDAVYAKDVPQKPGRERPDVKGSARRMILGEMTPLQIAYQDKLRERLDAIKARKGSPEKGQDIILSVITDGQHAAIDQRFIDPKAPADPNSKIELMINRVEEVWKEHQGERLTQMIFSDLGTPAAEEKRGWSSYNYIRKTLIARGIPAKEIAFMQDYKTNDAKKKLFDAMNRGDVRVLIGSSQAMGTGVNAQRLLKAVHHLDPDRYLPANITQREGRIVRQGNINKEVEIYAYATKGPSDESMWGVLERKQRFVDDFMQGQVQTDRADDIDAEANQFALARALSSRDPRVMQLAGLEADIERLSRLETAHNDDQVRLRRIIRSDKANIESERRMKAAAIEGLKEVTETRGEKFTAEILGKTYSEREEAGKALKAQMAAAITKAKAEGLRLAETVGKVAGLTIKIDVNKFADKFYAKLSLASKTNALASPLTDMSEEDLADKDPSQLVQSLETKSRSFADWPEQAEKRIAKLEQEIKDAEARLGLKFEKAAELAEKRKQAQEIKAALAAEENAAPEPGTYTPPPAKAKIDVETKGVLSDLDALLDADAPKFSIQVTYEPIEMSADVLTNKGFLKELLDVEAEFETGIGSGDTAIDPLKLSEQQFKKHVLATLKRRVSQKLFEEEENAPKQFAKPTLTFTADEERVIERLYAAWQAALKGAEAWVQQKKGLGLDAFLHGVYSEEAAIREVAENYDDGVEEVRALIKAGDKAVLKEMKRLTQPSKRLEAELFTEPLEGEKHSPFSKVAELFYKEVAEDRPLVEHKEVVATLRKQATDQAHNLLEGYFSPYTGFGQKELQAFGIEEYMRPGIVAEFEGAGLGAKDAEAYVKKVESVIDNLKRELLGLDKRKADIVEKLADLGKAKGIGHPEALRAAVHEILTTNVFPFGAFGSKKENYDKEVRVGEFYVTALNNAGVLPKGTAYPDAIKDPKIKEEIETAIPLLRAAFLRRIQETEQFFSQQLFFKRDAGAKFYAENSDFVSGHFAGSTKTAAWKYSYAGERATAGQSAAGLRANLSKRLGARAIEGLERAGFEIVETEDNLPDEVRTPTGAAVRGVYWKGKSYLVAGSIPEGTELGVVLHEVGVHAGLENLLGKQVYKEVLAQIKNPTGALARAVTAARTRVPNDTRAAHVTEETLAYLIEDTANRGLPLVRRILGAIRAWLLRHGFSLKEIRVEDLVAMARASVFAVSREEAKSLAWVRHRGTQLPEGGSPARSSGESVVTERDIIKATGIRHSRATADNHGHGLQAAKAALLNKRDVAAAVTHPTLGPITIGYGAPGTAAKEYRDGHGLSHIIARRTLEGEDPAETLVRVIDVLANGEPGRSYGPRRGERVDIKLGDYTAVVSLYRFGDKETWLLTGFKGMPGAQRVSVNPLGYAPEVSGIPQRVVADIVIRIDQALAELNKGPQGPLYSRAAATLPGLLDNGNVPPAPPPNPFSEENRRLREEDKTVWDRAKKFWQRNFTPGGLLPAAVFEQKNVRDGELGVVELDTENLVAQLDSAVKKVYAKRMEELNPDQRGGLQQALTGKVVESLDPRARTVIEAMRQHVDRLSGEYVAILEGQIADMTASGDPLAEARAGLLRTITGNLGRYVHRSYRAFDDPQWFSKLPNEVIDKARDYLRSRNIEGGMDPRDAADKAERALHTIVKTGTAYDSMEAFIREGKLGAKDLSILQRRKDIAPEIRALLGEYDDPRLNYAKSTSKMARLIWNTRFLDRVREIGMGTFLFEERDAPAGATTKIAADASEVYSPLNGLWTFPEIEQAFKDAVGKEKMADWYRVIVQMNGLVKFGKTVLSPTTSVRNWMSATFFSLANGHFDMRHVAKSVDTLRGKSPEYASQLVRLGIMDNGANAGEVMQLLRDSRIEDILRDKKSTPYRVWRDLNAFAKKAYRNGDDFWRIVGFENEKASLIRVGVPEAQAEREAALRIRNTYPTYSMVGRGIKWLARFPLAGTFVSFPAEIIRTSGHMLRYIAKDYQDPQRRPLALRRAAGLAMVSGFAYALQAITMAMMGMDDDEEEAVRRLAAPWQRNSNFLFTGRDENGQLRYFDLSFLDPYNWFKRPITALLRDQPWEDKATGALSDMLSPFLGTDIAAGALFEVLSNKKESGGPVYNEFANPVNQSVAIADHLRKALQPGFVGNIERTYRAAHGDYTPSGKRYSLADEGMSWIGWRVTTLDPKTSLYYRSFEFTDAKKAATSTLNKAIATPNEVSREAIASAKANAQRQLSAGFSDMHLIIDAAMKNGMTRPEVFRVLRTSGVSLRDIPVLLSGREPKLTVTPQQIRNATVKARAIYGPEKATEIQRRYQEASRLAL